MQAENLTNVPLDRGQMLFESSANFDSPSRLAPARWFCAYSWRVAIRRRHQEGGNCGTASFRFVDAPYGHFFADPFLVDEGEKTYLFAEDYSYFSRSATLACAELDPAGRLVETRTVLKRPYHLSYPQVFSVNGTYYMIPETAAANRVELYRAVMFPWQWELDRVLLSDVKLYDPTHAVVDGKHWIFAGGCSKPDKRHYDQLHLYHAESIHESFRPHQGNPVKTDIASTRPAGALRVSGDRLIRPAQDCRGWYGRGLTFMAVDVLDEHAYGETPLARLPDDWISGDHIGIHTFNSSARFEAIDVCYYGLEIAAFAGRARSIARFGRGPLREQEPSRPRTRAV